MSKLGITTHIVSISQENVVNRIIGGESVGTTVMPLEKKSNIKRWIAYGVPSGKVYINEQLYNLIRENKLIISILPVGIESYRGEFSKGDVIEIVSPFNDVIGFGVARYDFKKLHGLLGERNKPALIHYDYLYIID